MEACEDTERSKTIALTMLPFRLELRLSALDIGYAGAKTVEQPYGISPFPRKGQIKAMTVVPFTCPLLFVNLCDRSPSSKDL